MRKQPTSEAIEMMLDDPMLRMHLAYSWPHTSCSLCGGTAQAIFQVQFTVGDAYRCKNRPCAHDEVEDWYEYRLGCHGCFTSEWAKGIKPERELPKIAMFIRCRKPSGDEGYSMITVPVAFKRKSVTIVLPLTCLSQASPTVQILLS